MTQKSANEIISYCEKIPEELKSGIKVSKTIDGNPDSDTMTVMNPLDIEMEKI